MNITQTNKHIYRGGTQLRQNTDRYFYIKHVGWFLHTRGEHEITSGVELTNGIAGPFKSKAAAKYYLLKILYEQQPALFEDSDV